jgi:hypothetical protein
MSQHKYEPGPLSSPTGQQEALALLEGLPDQQELLVLRLLDPQVQQDPEVQRDILVQLVQVLLQDQLESKD